jgi:CheY-like chemotaxis protein
MANEVGDDRDAIHPDDSVLLIVEKDLPLARLLLETAHEKGFKGLVTSRGAAALTLTREYKPEAITLDLHLPDLDGWRVLERLKNDLSKRHIPVCVLSTEDARERTLAMGAFRFVAKPVQTKATLEAALEGIREYINRRQKELLLVAPDDGLRERIAEFLGKDDVHLRGVGTGAEGLALLRQRSADCLVLDPHLPDMTARAFVDELLREPAVAACPVVLPANGELPANDQAALALLALNQPVQQAHSFEQLLDQVALRLHAPLHKLPDDRRQLLEKLHQADQVLAGKKVLIVDDDIRNIFALTSILEWRNMVIVAAETGLDAIAMLQNQPDIDIVLMDIMMPEMDGMDTMRQIRKMPQFKDLPIIAVTAKAMKGDREKCIDAGAWDYLSKPVDAEQMLAVLRGWLHR